MEIFKDYNGYAPLSENLAPYFEIPFSKLPDEVKEILEGSRSQLRNWDSWTAEHRRLLL